MNLRPYLPDLLIGITLPLIVTTALLFPLVFPHGIPFYGDETYYISPTSHYFGIQASIWTWSIGRGASTSFLTLFVYAIPSQVLTALIGKELAVKAFIVCVAALPGILSYFALKILADEWKLFGTKKYVYLFASVGALFELLAFANVGLIGAATGTAFAYLTMPPTFAFVLRYLRKNQTKDLLLIGLISLFAAAGVFWIYLAAILIVLCSLSEIASSRKPLTTIKRSITLTAIILMFNAFWLVPSFAGYILSASGLFSSYTSTNLISFDGLQFLSHLNLLDAIMVGEHSYYFFWVHPQTYSVFNAIIPILAGLAILFFRKSRGILFMALVLILGLFLTKGVNPPGGSIYFSLAQNLPYGAGAILRNPTKFISLITFPYAFFTGFMISKLYEKFHAFDFSRYFRYFSKSSIVKLIAVGGLVLLVLVPITYGTLLDLRAYTWQNYTPTDIPTSYYDVNNWLLEQNGDFKVMWLPSGGSYVWKPEDLTGFPELFSSQPDVSYTGVYPIPWNSTNEIGRLLSILGVQYVIYHGDSITYPNEEILSNIVKQADLRPVYSSNFTYAGQTIPLIVFQNVDYKGPMYSSNIALTYGSDVTALLNYTDLDTARWTISSVRDDAELLPNLNSSSFFIYSDSSMPAWLSDSLIDSDIPLIYVFPRNNLSLSVNASASGGSQTVDASTKLCIYIPRPGEYSLAVKLNGQLKISGINMTSDGDWVYSDPIMYSSGNNTFDLSTDFQANIQGLVLFSNNQRLDNISDILEPKTVNSLKYVEISPVEWSISVNASAPFTLVFTEPYDSLWVAQVNGQSIKPTPLYSMINGFNVNETGSFTITVKYSLQSWLYYGSAISAVSFIACLVHITYNYSKSKRKIPII